ncbi:Clp protease ClpP [Sphingomonas sp. H39-1-10]|uniref:head maturation protease, ClpP-related n=1 Tax=Sphingomonas pollutisoli TaxID=3030829 RepID=UPI0023B88647|nr:head maturation protease, ClpP-related [Sphingomonas pollutisoli]MDF0489201.1 Clp protease ClpP [Sphingomonas pollutisoli]
MHRKLLNLAQDNRGKGSGLRSEATGADTTTVYVYDVIDGFWGVSAADFARELAAITTPKVKLRINSPGGDVFEARAMMTAIAEHPATFTAQIDGLAASAATALTIACDTVEIAEGGFYMIHQAWTFAMGNADDLTATAALLTKIDDVLIAGYAKKTGKPDAEISALMKAETWFSAQEAVDNGFADAIAAAPDKAAKAQARAFNLAAFANAPKALTEKQIEIDETVRVRMLARLNLYERTAA